MNKINGWKTYSYRALLTLQILFVSTITWDFFLTVLVKASHRANVLLGASSAIAPIIIFFWILAIVGLSILAFNSSKEDMEDAGSIHTRYEYFFLALAAILYILLAWLAIANPLVLWPIVINYLVNIGWVSLLVYFRYYFSRV